MKQFIDKLIERLEAIEEHCLDMHDWQGQSAIVEAKEIVNQLAEEHKDDIQTIDVSELLQGNDGWIACSERVPNESERWLGKDITDAEPREFIVMVKGAYEPTTGYYTVDGWVKDIYDKENGSGYANEIIAWRFFPKPYQPKGQAND